MTHTPKTQRTPEPIQSISSALQIHSGGHRTPWRKPKDHGTKLKAYRLHGKNLKVTTQEEIPRAPSTVPRANAKVTGFRKNTLEVTDPEETSRSQERILKVKVMDFKKNAQGQTGSQSKVTESHRNIKVTGPQEEVPRS